MSAVLPAPTAASLAPRLKALPDQELLAEARGILGTHARTFSLAGALLPAAALDRAAIVYGFCRTVDDVVDEAPSIEQAEADLDRLIEQLEGGPGPWRMVAAYRTWAPRWGIPDEAAEGLIAGCRSDLTEVRVADDDELALYCYRVAGVVGLMMCGVCDVRNPAARTHALHLGMGMQLSNICRDVREDALRGRVYLPADRLRAAGLEPQVLVDEARAGAFSGTTRQAVARVVADLLELAERYYESGFAGMRYIPVRARLGIAAAAAMYRQIGRRLRPTPGRTLDGRTVVPMWDKLRCALGGIARSLFS